MEESRQHEIEAAKGGSTEMDGGEQMEVLTIDATTAAMVSIHNNKNSQQVCLGVMATTKGNGNGDSDCRPLLM